MAVADGPARVRPTMTSAACPLSDLIIDTISDELGPVLSGYEREVDLCWEPAWTPERMLARARAVMGG